MACRWSRDDAPRAACQNPLAAVCSEVSALEITVTFDTAAGTSLAELNHQLHPGCKLDMHSHSHLHLHLMRRQEAGEMPTEQHDQLIVKHEHPMWS